MTCARLLAACLALALCAPSVVAADPWKDESGHRGERARGGGDRRGDRDLDRGGRRDAWGWPLVSHVQPRVPPGHLPPPGECRLWYPGLPPGQQPPPGRC
jgi:hypothetical protein